MNRFLSFLVIIYLITFSQNSFSQKIDLKDDIIHIDGKAYAKLKKKSAGMLRYDYTVSNLDELELIYIKSELVEADGTGYAYGNNKLIYQVTFIQSGNYAYIDHLNTKGMVKLVVDNKLVNKDQIDIKAEERFIRINRGVFINENKPSANVVVNNYLGGDTTKNNSEKSSKLNSINTRGIKIQLDNNSYTIDGIDMGTYRLDSTTSSYSKIEHKLTIYTIDGEKICVATAPKQNPEEWLIKTMKDNAAHQVLFDVKNPVQTVIRWLLSKSYIIKDDSSK